MAKKREMSCEQALNMLGPSGYRKPAEPDDEDHPALATITAAVRAADRHFERVGGSSRHWVHDCFLPELERHGLFIGVKPKPHPPTCPCVDCT